MTGRTPDFSQLAHLPITIDECGKENLAIMVRFEDCLCAAPPLRSKKNVIDFPLGPKTERTYERPFEVINLTQKSFRPIELETEISRLANKLRWKSGAVWFLRCLSRMPKVRLFILTDYPELLVRAKMRSSPIRTQILGSVIQYDSASGLYQPRFHMDLVGREAITEAFVKSAHFQQIVYIGARQDDIGSLEKTTGIFIGDRSKNAGPGQFSARNLMEANSILKTILAA